MEQQFIKLPDGSLIMRRPQPPETKPGMLAGLLSRLMPKGPQGPRYWMPEEMAIAARETAPSPLPAQIQGPPPVQGAPAANLPPYSAWSEIEDQVAKEQRIREALGDLPKKVMGSKELIEGKWFAR